VVTSAYYVWPKHKLKVAQIGHETPDLFANEWVRLFQVPPLQAAPTSGGC
jgi:hypothetical protein